ncbi:hypothetical protein [Mesorhizobium hawassense]|uniref:hypothetical protein n=1 Tax=Mesorhizobium hawassense TaxID=1209954 RepID=UPI001FDEDE27|nr:hypothetical protein [Mesorhizobium hawassense]
MAFVVTGLAAAGFGADCAGAAFAVVLALGAAALAALGASLAAAALAFAFAGAVVLAAFATCLSLSPSIWGARFKEASSTPVTDFREIPPIIYVLPLSAAVQALPQRQAGERFALDIACLDGLPHRACASG